MSGNIYTHTSLTHILTHIIVHLHTYILPWTVLFVGRNAKKAAKPQWKKPKKEKENPKHIIFVVGLGASAAGSAGTLRGALRTLWK